MIGISRILVGLNDSEYADRVFEYALYIAKKCEVEQLLLINVIEEFGLTIESWERQESVIKEIEQNTKELLEKYKSKAQSQAFTRVKVMMAEGNAGEEILRAADKENVDAIVIGHRGRSIKAELLLGSVSQNVIHHAKCPVLIVR
jgi:nucleotide-binding universal stress UspA family protein